MHISPLDQDNVPAPEWWKAVLVFLGFVAFAGGYLLWHYKKVPLRTWSRRVWDVMRFKKATPGK
jgi:hypothetical protein